MDQKVQRQSLGGRVGGKTGSQVDNDNQDDGANRVNPLEKRCEDLKLLRCLIRPSLRHEKHRSFLFSRLDLLNRTDPGEAVRNVEYML
jgi:hypothetical protein